ncbi:hypothetical protein [Vibrio furnissii]|uniref:hypothetical protein n=1 Tax=Vibrio furnissii TaxID=29494 RepID=UPI001EEABE9F|nr:hypothetical protein [Vibrio furnissii]MCG6268055.1 hypothetical protein [Vibrio furnissii]
MKVVIDIVLNVVLACIAGWAVGWPFGVLYIFIFGLMWSFSNQLIDDLKVSSSCLSARVAVNTLALFVAFVASFFTEKTLSVSAKSQSAQSEAIDTSLKGLSAAEGTLGAFRDGMKQNSEALKNQAESFNMYNNVFCELNWWQMTLLIFLVVNVLVSVFYIFKSKNNLKKS